MEDRHIATAIQLLKRIPLYEIFPNVTMYTPIVDSMFKVGMAFELLNVMCSKNLITDKVNFEILIDGLEKSRRIDDALELIQLGY
ncbi:hypothetical protein Ahy_A05g022965 [Arachis hypogaea]|uniref:Pentatricopeptide repeat-containing protein n=1 Tax=Arachis hypogaea TaxID=3818 RepID=A0A445D1Z7_ARAHY|nr:hypothetical protein Ahy_A05g022965 [Arachis hypogaea]